MKSSRSNAERSKKTRTLLLKVARELFAKQGYADTSTEEIVRRTNITRGALYYHFRTKAGLFEAVVEDVRTELIHKIRVRIQAAEGNTWQRIVVTGCQAFIESIADPSVRRIIHVDAPTVLPQRSLEIAAPGLTFLEELLASLMAEGLLEKVPTKPLSRLLWAMFFEAGVCLSQAENRTAATAEISAMLLRVVTGLQPQSQPGDGRVGQSPLCATD